MDNHPTKFNGSEDLFQLFQIEKDIVCIFFLMFSRFEFALKRTSSYLKNNQGKAEPDWDKFGRDHDSLFISTKSSELIKAVDYLEHHPPRKQVIINGKLDWDFVGEGNAIRLVVLLLAVRRVRNNLFHGGKFITPVDDPARDANLLKSCMVVLKECLLLNRDVENYFYEK